MCKPYFLHLITEHNNLPDYFNMDTQSISLAHNAFNIYVKWDLHNVTDYRLDYFRGKIEKSSSLDEQ